MAQLLNLTLLDCSATQNTPRPQRGSHPVGRESAASTWTHSYSKLLDCSVTASLQPLRGSHPDGRESASPVMGGNVKLAALLLYDQMPPGRRGGLTREGGSQPRL